MFGWELHQTDKDNVCAMLELLYKDNRMFGWEEPKVRVKC